MGSICDDGLRKRSRQTPSRSDRSATTVCGNRKGRWHCRRPFCVPPVRRRPCRPAARISATSFGSQWLLAVPATGIDGPAARRSPHRYSPPRASRRAGTEITSQADSSTDFSVSSRIVTRQRPDIGMNTSALEWAWAADALARFAGYIDDGKILHVAGTLARCGLFRRPTDHRIAVPRKTLQRHVGGLERVIPSCPVR